MRVKSKSKETPQGRVVRGREITRVPTANGVWLLRLLTAANGPKRTLVLDAAMSALRGEADIGYRRAGCGLALGLGA
jgi:hypothetical protein